LSAAAWCFRNNQRPTALLSDRDPRPLFETTMIPCEPNIRRLFDRHLARIIGPSSGSSVMDLVYKAFLSETEDIATPIFRFLAIALETRCDPSGCLCEPAVAAVAGAARRAAGQAHHYLGLLRFRAVSPDFYLADFAPDCNVLPLVLPHFCDRLPDQDFAIRDLRRHLAALHLADGSVSIHILADEQVAGTPDDHAIAVAAPTGEDDSFGPLWQLYLKRLSIPERRNPKLQQANMPKKYWPYLTEFDAKSS
jgi:probable DNA metabolism protein